MRMKVMRRLVMMVEPRGQVMDEDSSFLVVVDYDGTRVPGVAVRAFWGVWSLFWVCGCWWR